MMRTKVLVESLMASSVLNHAAKRRDASGFLPNGPDTTGQEIDSPRNKHSILSCLNISSSSSWLGSLPYDLDQRPLPPAAVEFTIENLLPRPEIELPFSDR